jgi:hypothetical protein
MNEASDFFLSKKEEEEFEKWAFGDDFDGSLKLVFIPEKWNKLHGDKLMILATGNRKKDIENMIKLWKKERSCKSTIV